MARTKILVPPEKQCGYTSVIVSYSTGIDSTGAIYWATQNFAPEKIFLLYCDTGAEYSVNEALFFKTAKVLGLKLDLCQYFEHKKLKGYADFFNSSSSFCCGVI